MKTVKFQILNTLIVVFMLSAVSCNDFEDINTNPNSIVYGEARPTKMLPNIIFDGNWQVLYRSWRLNSELMQYSLHTNALEHASNYDIAMSDPQILWNELYESATNANHMYNLAEEFDESNSKAIALTMKVYYASYLTDIFGDIPYSQAFQWADGIHHPEFDLQKDIYIQMLAELKEANTFYNTSVPLDYPSRDLLYGGDITKWKKFTNSLRLRLLMRVSKCPEIDGAGEMQEMISNPTIYPVFQSNADAAILYFTGISPNYNRFGSSGTTDPMHQNTCIGKTLTDIMNRSVDPRLSYYFKSKNGEYEGMLSGQNSDYIASNLSLTCTYNPSLSTDTSPSAFMNYAEVQFILAEAAFRGLITTGSAKTYYENGVRASVKQWCGEAVDPTAMLLTTGAKYDGTLIRIMEQKYVADFLVGFEAWCDYRRTGLPEMPAGPAMINKDIYGNPVLPTRFNYPVITQTTNYDNYRKAVERMNGVDNMLTKVWWATGTNY